VARCHERKLAKHIIGYRRKKVKIKEEPFIECHPPLQELSLSSYESLSALLQDLKENKIQKKKKNN